MEPERLAYDLDESALVWDVGAYLGEFSLAAAYRWWCTVHAFEPIPEFNEQFAASYDGPEAIHQFQFGLADHDFEADMPLAGDRTTLYPEQAAMHLEFRPGAPVRVSFRDVVRFLDEHAIPQVDLAKINIEGGEYPLLRRLIDSGRIMLFKHLQVQFHTFVPQFGELYKALEADLKRTHTLDWRWPWRWESWTRK